MYKTKKNKISWKLEFDNAWKLVKVKSYKEYKDNNTKETKFDFNLSWIK